MSESPKESAPIIDVVSRPGESFVSFMKRLRAQIMEVIPAPELPTRGFAWIFKEALQGILKEKFPTAERINYGNFMKDRTIWKQECDDGTEEKWMGLYYAKVYYKGSDQPEESIWGIFCPINPNDGMPDITKGFTNHRYVDEEVNRMMEDIPKN